MHNVTSIRRPKIKTTTAIITLYDFFDIQYPELLRLLEGRLKKTVEERSYTIGLLSSDLQQAYLLVYLKLKHILKTESPIVAAAISSDGRREIIGMGNNASIIDVATGKALFTKKFNAPVKSVAISADGRSAIAGVSDGTVQMITSGESLELKELQELYQRSISGENSAAAAAVIEEPAALDRLKNFLSAVLRKTK